MREFEIVADSSNDLPEKFINENNIKNVSFYITLDGENYLEDQVEITREEMYSELRNNKELYPKTSLPSVDSYYKVFKAAGEEGKDVICFTISGGLSGSFQSAKVAADLALEEYSDMIIELVDSQSASLGVGILVEKAVEYRNEGKNITEIADILRKVSDTTEIYISLETLSYLERGGRIGKASALAGAFLKLKPVLIFSENIISPAGTARGSKRAVEKALELLDNKIGSNPDAYRVFIVHGDNEETAIRIKDTIEEKYNIVIESEISLVSATVISHIGPGAIAIGCMERI